MNVCSSTIRPTISPYDTCSCDRALDAQERASKQLPGPGQHFSFGSIKPWDEILPMLDGRPSRFPCGSMMPDCSLAGPCCGPYTILLLVWQLVGASTYSICELLVHDGPKQPSLICHPVWFIAYHGNSHAKIHDSHPLQIASSCLWCAMARLCPTTCLMCWALTSGLQWKAHASMMMATGLSISSLMQVKLSPRCNFSLLLCTCPWLHHVTFNSDSFQANHTSRLSPDRNTTWRCAYMNRSDQVG